MSIWLCENWLRRGCLVILVALLLFAARVRAGEEEDLYGQLMHRYEILNAELQAAINEYERPGPVSEYPDRLLSIRKSGAVTVGGELRTNYVGSDSTWSDPNFNPDLPDKGKSEAKIGRLSITTAKLLVDVRASERWRAFFEMNLKGTNGFHNPGKLENPNRPGDYQADREYIRSRDNDILGQAYIELMKEGHSGFGFIVGRLRMPFGLWDRPNLFAQSFLDAPNLSGSYLMGPDGWDNIAVLPHASRFMDPVVAAMINYEMRDIVRFDAAIFQEKDEKEFVYDRDGVRRSRSDNALPRSWQVGLSLQPLEGWELTAHFRNRYSRSRGVSSWANTPQRWDFTRNLASGRKDPRWDSDLGQWSDTGDGPSFGSRSNEQALIVGLAVEIPNTNLSASVEYAHGWNQGFNKHISSDDVNVGLAYRATPFLTLHAQGEWMQVKDRSWMAKDGSGGWQRDRRNHHLYRVMVGAEYELAKGVTLEAGWQYEYWRARSALNSPQTRTNKANMFYIGSRFIF